MARTTSTTVLAKTIKSLRTERQKLAARLAAIDAAFSQLGIGPDAKANTAAAVVRGRRRGNRRKFGQTAEEFVLGLLKGKKLASGQINKAWKAAKRAGVSNNTLTKLTKAKKIVRQTVKGQKGGTYSVA